MVYETNQFVALEWQPLNTAASFKNKETISVNYVAAMMVCVGSPSAKPRTGVTTQYSGNGCALVHSGKMRSMALPENDPFIFSL